MSLEKFETICPACSYVFELNRETMYKGFDDERAEEFVTIGCPDCDHEIQIFDLREETEI